MRFCLNAFVTIVLPAMLLSGMGDAAQGGMIYDIVNSDPTIQQGWTVSGFIETDGSIGDQLTPANILDWKFTATDGTRSYTVQSGVDSIYGHFSATTTNLYLTPPPNDVQWIATYNPATLNAIQWATWYDTTTQQTGREFDIDGAGVSFQSKDFQSTGPWLVASTPVPEPCTLVIWSTLGALCLTCKLCNRQRQEQQPRQCVSA